MAEDDEQKRQYVHARMSDANSSGSLAWHFKCAFIHIDPYSWHFQIDPFERALIPTAGISNVRFEERPIGR